MLSPRWPLVTLAAYTIPFHSGISRTPRPSRSSGLITNVGQSSEP
ncbi:hypothetical protein CSUI_004382, partial [Cystoisospora suis]